MLFSTSLRRAAAATAASHRNALATPRFMSSLMSDVHGTTHGKKHWKNKPLFRREGDKKFRNGQEAADMLCVQRHWCRVSLSPSHTLTSTLSLAMLFRRTEEATRRDPYQVRDLPSSKHYVSHPWLE